MTRRRGLIASTCAVCGDPVELVQGLTVRGHPTGLVVLEAAAAFDGDWVLEHPLFDVAEVVARQLNTIGGNRRLHPCADGVPSRRRR